MNKKFIGLVLIFALTATLGACKSGDGGDGGATPGASPAESPSASPS